MALCKRVVRFGANTLAQVTALSAQGQGGANSGGYFATKFCNCKLNAFSSFILVESLNLVKTLEAEGMSHHQARAVAHGIANVANEILDAKMQEEKSRIDREFARFHREMELLRSEGRDEIARVRDELRGEMQLMSSGFKSDLAVAQSDFLMFFIGIFTIGPAVGLALANIFT